MKSIREIYKTGKGPSSSHTMGPERAANYFKNAHPQADGFRVILYGSLSKTGVGHGTDRVLREVLAPSPRRSCSPTRRSPPPPTPTPWT